MKAKKNDPTDVSVFNLEGVIGWDVTAKNLKNFLKNKKNVTIKIESGGGSIFEGNQMYNALKAHEYFVRVEIGSAALSAAGYVALAGDEVVVHKNSTWMAHRAWGIAVGDADEVRLEASVLEGLESIIAQTISDEIGKSKEEVLAGMKSEIWLFGSEQIVDFGIASSVIDGDDDDDSAQNESQNRLLFRSAMETNYKNSFENIENHHNTVKNFVNFLNNKDTQSNFEEETEMIEQPKPAGAKNSDDKSENFDAGVTQERNRVKAWNVYADIDPDFARKGIDSGESMNEADVAHFNRKKLDSNFANNLAEESPEGVQTPDPEKPEVKAPAAENSSTFNEDEANFLLNLKKGGK